MLEWRQCRNRSEIVTFRVVPVALALEYLVGQAVAVGTKILDVVMWAPSTLLNQLVQIVELVPEHVGKGDFQLLKSGRASIFVNEGKSVWLARVCGGHVVCRHVPWLKIWSQNKRFVV